MSDEFLQECCFRPERREIWTIRRIQPWWDVKVVQWRSTQLLCVYRLRLLSVQHRFNQSTKSSSIYSKLPLLVVIRAQMRSWFLLSLGSDGELRISVEKWKNMRINICESQQDPRNGKLWSHLQALKSVMVVVFTFWHKNETSDETECVSRDIWGISVTLEVFEVYLVWAFIHIGHNNQLMSTKCIIRNDQFVEQTGD